MNLSYKLCRLIDLPQLAVNSCYVFFICELVSGKGRNILNICNIIPIREINVSFSLWFIKYL
jgi:hypothetical protein